MSRGFSSYLDIRRNVHPTNTKKDTQTMYYELTNDTITHNGKTLYRIRATQDLPQHNVKKGDLGGYVETTDNLFGNAWLFDNAKAYGKAKVYGSSHLHDEVEACDNARIFGNTKAYGSARLRGGIHLSGNSEVYGDTYLYDISSARSYKEVH